jgi:hypothetical protein
LKKKQPGENQNSVKHMSIIDVLVRMIKFFEAGDPCCSNPGIPLSPHPIPLSEGEGLKVLSFGEPACRTGRDLGEDCILHLACFEHLRAETSNLH